MSFGLTFKFLSISHLLPRSGDEMVQTFFKGIMLIAAILLNMGGYLLMGLYFSGININLF